MIGMPLPEPELDESREEFLERCMSDGVMISEFADAAQRFAVCLSLWSEKEEEGGRKMEERKAIPVHHTATSGGAWDGPKAEANLRNDGDADYYRQAYAWQNPEKDPDTKSAYKLIHHEVNADGDVGPANVKACQSAIGVLNGARGGADIPPEDREGVWRHLAAHIKDAGLEPAPLARSDSWVGQIMGDYEIRTFSAGELRISLEKDGGLGVLSGKPGIPYGSWSEDLGGFVECIVPGAVNYESYDIVCCRDHEDHLVLGRVSAGTLRLEETQKGLDYTCDLPDVSYARDLAESIKRGDVRGSSFRFDVVADIWKPSRGGEPAKREIHEMVLYEIGPVTMPAYPQTAITMRSIFRSAGIDLSQLMIAVRRVRSGDPRGEDAEIIGKAITSLRRLAEASRQGAEGAAPENRSQGRLEILRKRLELLEMEL